MEVTDGNGWSKRCRACRELKPETDFAVRSDRRNGRGRITICKSCDRAKAAAYYAENKAAKAARYQDERAELAETAQAVRAAAVRIYGGRCTQCGSDERLEFDHINDDGRKHRAREHHRSMLRRIVATGTQITDFELQLLCFPCHRARSTLARRAGRRP